MVYAVWWCNLTYVMSLWILLQLSSIRNSFGKAFTKVKNRFCLIQTIEYRFRAQRRVLHAQYRYVNCRCVKPVKKSPGRLMFIFLSSKIRTAGVAKYQDECPTFRESGKPQMTSRWWIKSLVCCPRTMTEFSNGQNFVH